MRPEPAAYSATRDGARGASAQVHAVHRTDAQGRLYSLYLRRLLLGSGGAHATRSSNGIRKSRREALACGASASVGTVFGATLKSIFEFAGVETTRVPSVRAMEQLVHFLAPARAQMPRVGGADRAHLASGLGSSCVHNKQKRHLRECIEPQAARSYLGRNGLKDVAFGATAAILAAHHIMRARGTEAEDVVACLDASTQSVDALLQGWSVGEVRREQWECTFKALHAEQRAIARARCAAVAARATIAAELLPVDDGLRLCLDWMRASAWPADTTCEADGHYSICERIARRECIRDRDGAIASMLPPVAVPLSALPTPACLQAGLALSDTDSSRSASRTSTASTRSESGGEGSECDMACRLGLQLAEL